jgi:hypothetical protein
MKALAKITRMPRLVSWNVNARTRRLLLHQAEAVLDLKPDLVAAQEVTASNVSAWSTALARPGSANRSAASTSLTTSHFFTDHDEPVS